MTIDEAYIDSLAPNANAVKNARGLVLKKKLVALLKSADGKLLFGECKGSGKDNYRPSCDLAQEGNPVFRCSCPSRQFPCKHGLALMYSFVQGDNFTVQEIPPDLVEKREKAQVRATKKKETASKPKKVNKNALKKKIEAQLKGLDLLESLVADLVSTGLGTINSKTARQVEDQAKQLGDAFLPGAQSALHAFTGLFYRTDQYDDDEVSGEKREKIYSAALDQLNRLHTLGKQGRKYLQGRLEDPDLKPETESSIAGWLGHAWQLRELKEAGLVQENIELLQLAFSAEDDWARRAFVDTGYWLNLNSGSIQMTENIRPYRAAKHIKEDDSVFDILCVPELCVYPGNLNPRIRWDEAKPRSVTKKDYVKAFELSQTDYPELIKTIKAHLKSPLAHRTPLALVQFNMIAQVDGHHVIESEHGERLVLSDDTLSDGPSVIPLLAMLPAKAKQGQVMLLKFRHDLDTQTLHATPLSILTKSELIRLTL